MFMYYPIHVDIKGLRPLLVLILILVVSLFAFQSEVFADTFDNTAEEYRLKGYAEQKKGNLHEALTYYSKAMSLGLKSAVIYNDIGVVYEEMGVDLRALEFYKKAINVDKQYLAPYTNLAYFYKDRNDEKQSIKFFLKRFQLAPDGDPWKEKARAELYELDPKFKRDAVRHEVRKLNHEIAVKAQQEFELQIIRANNHYLQGQKLVAGKQWQTGIEEFGKALAITPENPKILKAIKRAKYNQQIDDIKKRTEDAIKQLESGEVKSAKQKFQQILTIIPSEPVQLSK